MLKQKPLSFIWQIIKPYKWWYVCLCLAPLSVGVLFNLSNWAIKTIIDTIVGDVLSYKAFVYPFLIFCFIELLIRFLWSLHDYSEYKVQGRVFRDVIVKPYEYLQNHSYQFFQGSFSGSLVSKIKGINDGFYSICDNISHKTLESISLLVCNAVMISFVCITLLPPVGLMICMFGLLNYLQSKKYSKYAFESRSNYHRVLGLLSDRVINIFTIFNFAKKQKEVQDVDTFYQNTCATTLDKMNYFNFLSWLVLGTMYSTMFLCVFAYVFYLRKHGSISTGELTIAMYIVIRSCHEVFRLSHNLTELIRNFADFRASFEGIFVKQEVIDKTNPENLTVSKGEIVFRNLSFSYENNNKVFDNLNLHIKAGQKVGIVGHSGAGKSTLVSLLLKHFKAIDGDIIIDNQSIYDVSSDSLRSQISLIPQDIMLFHRSIGENIGYAKDDATQEEIEIAAKMANIHEFIMGLPEEYNTLVGERGVKLSGGQRQRIAIARAILKNAPILILDEATSALDSQTEQEIGKSINTMLETNNATVIAIAHRLSTIKHMDRIVVMESGLVVEDGSFEELVSKEGGKFKELWEHQVNGMVV
jgi:ATP-binding cassette subfamily B protein